MAWLKSNTLYMSISLFLLPVAPLVGLFSLPFIIAIIVSLYLFAWYMFYMHARTDNPNFKLPYNPSTVLKINSVLLGHALDWIGYIPLIVSYLHWRYWQFGAKGFKQIVSLNIQYNDHSKLDVYHPNVSSTTSQAPIIIFIYGGGWGSGSKLIYSTLANTLRKLGYVVVMPDYRKYPEVKADQMYKDVRDTIKWTYQHAKEINGDPEQIFVMGHSAGAQLIAYVVLSDLIDQIKYRKAMQTSAETTVDTDFLPLVEGLLLFSGVYDIAAHLVHETSRGVEKLSAMARAMGSSNEGYIANSPLYMLEQNKQILADARDLIDLIPRILLLHGQKDTTVGMEQSTRMFNRLGELFTPDDRDQVDVRMRLYKRMGHSEPVLALMWNMFSERPEQKLLLRDIKEFIDESQQLN